ncbi:MAG: DUF58 domain-containing protein [Chloroflexi bacterium]|nr:DUF58 domain-containing protein [Chloroflexota bacterium]
MPLFDEKTLRKLDRLALVAARVRAGQIRGERRSTKRGTSIEFADYRNYTRGDDLRRVDWNVYARLERPFIKLLEEEEDLAVHILVDASRSMEWGEGEYNKFDYALILTAALGYIALAAGDRLTVTMLRSNFPFPPHPNPLPLGEGRVRGVRQFGPARGRGHLLPLLTFLDEQAGEGTTDLNAQLRDYALAARRPGLAFVLTDLFSPAGYTDGLNALQGRGYEVSMIHLLAPDELEPPLAGDLRLMDVETGAGQEVTLDGSLRELYKRRVVAWRDEIESHCLKRDVHYVPVVTSTAWERLVLYHLRRQGLVK